MIHNFKISFEKNMLKFLIKKIKKNFFLLKNMKKDIRLIKYDVFGQKHHKSGFLDKKKTIYLIIEKIILYKLYISFTK